jgi:hypothetical protein
MPIQESHFKVAFLLIGGLPVVKMAIYNNKNKIMNYEFPHITDIGEVRKFWGDVNWLEFRKPLDVELTVKGYLINLYKKVVDRIRQFWLVK